MIEPEELGKVWYQYESPAGHIIHDLNPHKLARLLGNQAAMSLVIYANNLLLPGRIKPVEEEDVLTRALSIYFRDVTGVNARDFLEELEQANPFNRIDSPT